MGVALDYRLATDEVGDLRQVERGAVDLDVGQGLGDIRVLHEPELQDDLVHPGIELAGLAALLVEDAGDVSGDDGHEEGGGVQHLVVSEVVDQGGRRHAGIFEHEDGRSLHGNRVTRLLEDLRHRALSPADAGGHQLPATTPCGHLQEQTGGDEDREPAAGGDLGDVGGEEDAVDRQERGDHEKGLG